MLTPVNKKKVNLVYAHILENAKPDAELKKVLLETLLEITNNISNKKKSFKAQYLEINNVKKNPINKGDENYIRELRKQKNQVVNTLSLEPYIPAFFRRDFCDRTFAYLCACTFDPDVVNSIFHNFAITIISSYLYSIIPRQKLLDILNEYIDANLDNSEWLNENDDFLSPRIVISVLSNIITKTGQFDANSKPHPFLASIVPETEYNKQSRQIFAKILEQIPEESKQKAKETFFAEHEKTLNVFLQEISSVYKKINSLSVSILEAIDFYDASKPFDYDGFFLNIKSLSDSVTYLHKLDTYCKCGHISINDCPASDVSFCEFCKSPDQVAFGAFLACRDLDNQAWIFPITIDILDEIMITYTSSCLTECENLSRIPLLPRWNEPLSESAKDTVHSLISSVFPTYPLSNIYELSEENKEKVEKIGLNEQELTALTVCANIAAVCHAGFDIQLKIREADCSCDEDNEDELPEDTEKAELTSRVSEQDKTISQLQSKCSLLQEIANNAKNERESFSEQNKIMENRIKMMKKEIVGLQKQISDESEEVQNEGHDLFPYETKNNIVVFGGHKSWLKNIRKLLPEVRFLETPETIDENIIRNCDGVFIQINCIDHSNFYKITQVCSVNNIPCKTFERAGAKQCARAIIAFDQKY